MEAHRPWCGGSPCAESATERRTETNESAEQSANEESRSPAESIPNDGPREITSVRPTEWASYTVNGTVFEVPRYLEFLRALGQGTYGAVAAFRDLSSGKDVAIKRIPIPVRNPTDCKRCLREIKLLSMLKHENVIRLQDLLPVTSPSFAEVYLVTELMDADLHTVINSRETLRDDHVQYFMYQIILALQYLHSANVVHRDLKPLNVLVNQNCDVKLCDFGLARGRAGFAQEDFDFLRTEYVGTRWYRAPEIILTSMAYTAAVDIWSAGCILGELISRAPTFRGSDFLDQIRTIVEVLGTPDDEQLDFIPPCSEAARAFIKTKFPGVPRRSWSSMYATATEEQCDMLENMLQFDPNRRMSAKEALRHVFFTDLYDQEDESLAETHIDWSFDSDFQEDMLHIRIYQEILAKHPWVVERDYEELMRRGWISDGEGSS